MAELPPEMERLIEAARRAHDPSDVDFERVRRGVAAALGAQASLGQSGASEGAVGSASSGTVGSLFGATGGKLLVVVALVGGAGGVWSWRASSESRRATGSVVPVPALVTPALPADPPPQPRPIVEGLALDAHAPLAVARGGEPARPAGAPAAKARRAAARARAEQPRRGTGGTAPLARQARGTAALAAPQEMPSEPMPALDQQAVEPARSAEAVNAARAVDAIATQRVPTAQEVPREIAREESEVALIRAAFASLNASEPQRALELLEAYALRYPIGAMGRERAGLRVLALCALGRLPEGRREQAAFLDAASDSPLQNRVRRACE